jgi:biotin carboxyl carrier protein
MPYIVKVDGREYKVGVGKEGSCFSVTLDGKPRTVEIVEYRFGQMILVVDNQSYRVVFESEEELVVDGTSYEVKTMDEQIQRLIKARPETFHTKELSIRAPMPGLVVELLVKEGEKVENGQGLLIVEAMKMQNEMKSTRDGIVKNLSVKQGQTVNSGDTLIVIE